MVFFPSTHGRLYSSLRFYLIVLAFSGSSNAPCMGNSALSLVVRRPLSPQMSSVAEGVFVSHETPCLHFLALGILLSCHGGRPICLMLWSGDAKSAIANGLSSIDSNDFPTGCHFFLPPTESEDPRLALYFYPSLRRSNSRLSTSFGSLTITKSSTEDTWLTLYPLA